MSETFQLTSEREISHEAGIYEEGVRLLQRVREAILVQRALVDSFTQIQAEDEHRFAQRGTPGIMSRNGYHALQHMTEQTIRELEEDQRQLEGWLDSLRRARTQTES